MTHVTHIIVIPPTTPYTVVFPHSPVTGQFDTSFYSPMLTDGRAHPEEINRVLRELEAAGIPLTKRYKANVCCFILTLMLSIFAFMTFTFLMVSVNPALIPIGVVLLAVVNILTGSNFMKKIKHHNVEFRRLSQEVIDRANQEFSYKGLRWVLPTLFPRWVELWKDYQPQNDMNTGVQQPYANYGPGGAAQPQFQQNFYPGYQNNAGYMPPNQV